MSTGVLIRERCHHCQEEGRRQSAGQRLHHGRETSTALIALVFGVKRQCIVLYTLIYIKIGVKRLVIFLNS